MLREARHWPTSAEELCRLQAELALQDPPQWWPPQGPYSVGGCFVCFARGTPPPGEQPDWAGGEPGWAGGEPGWAGAAVVLERRIVARALITGRVRAPYRPGLLALREGPLLEAAVRALAVTPQVLIVDATGRDHPRRAGLALHLGAVIGTPTIGVTHRPLLAFGEWPALELGARSPLVLDGETVGCWLRTRQGARPLAIHAGWRTNLDTACSVVLAASERVRAPAPLREARRVARRARAGESPGI